MKYTLDIPLISSKGSLYLHIEGKPTAKDAPFLAFLQQRQIHLGDLIEIPQRYSYEAFKLLAALGALHANGKQLLIDLYGKSTLAYRVKSGGACTGELHFNGKIIPLAEAAAIGGGDPHWFLHGMMIRFIHTEISWTELSKLRNDPKSIAVKDLQEILDSDEEKGPKVFFDENAKFEVDLALRPLPQLRLHDRTGAFADLWMDYKNDRQVPYHDRTFKSDFKRDFGAESAWEKDLLETGFQKKIVGKSHYFCPMDRVAKSLSFLLELGWHIQDAQNRTVVKQNGQHLTASTEGDTIHIRGSLDFGDHQADVKDFYGAFTRREKFIELGKNTVGLLDDAGFSAIEDAKVSKDGIEFKRSSFAAMEGLFDRVTLDAPLQNLKALITEIPEPANLILPKEFKGSLRHYQQTGVEWLQRLCQLNLHGLLADDMGLGKTVQVIAFLSTRPTDKPTLIIVPTTLIFNWVKEFEKFLPGRKILIHQGSERTKNPQVLKEAEIILATYTTVRMDVVLFEQISLSHLILDEAQAIKNAETQTAQAMGRLKADFRLSMTGTPIENRFSELWSHFHFLIPDLFDDLQTFETEANRDTRRLKRKVKPFLLRRKKDEVAQDLPEKIEQVVWVEMGEAQRNLYEGFLAQIKGKTNSKSNMEVLEAILRLRQLCCHPMLISGMLESDESLESAKFSALFADLETLLAENQKVLIYSQFTSMLSLMTKEAKNRGWKFSSLDGTTKNREAQVQQFQENSDIPLFFISLKAGGAGLNLTAADAVLIYDPWWNDAVERQAIDRAHRMGRMSPVLAKRYIIQESVEEKMMKIKESKNQLAGDLMEEELSNLRLTAEDLAFLLS